MSQCEKSRHFIAFVENEIGNGKTLTGTGNGIDMKEMLNAFVLRTTEGMKNIINCDFRTILKQVQYVDYLEWHPYFSVNFAHVFFISFSVFSSFILHLVLGGWCLNDHSQASANASAFPLSRMEKSA
jgi:hypothetical protein